MSEWRPSPALATAMHEGMATLARHWPKQMSLALEASEAGRAFTADYGRAMINVDFSAIPLAAERWVANESYAPKPAELAKLAREIDRERRPMNVVRGDYKSDAPTFDTTKQFEQIDKLSLRAHGVLKSWPLVSEVWSLLWYVNPHEDYREATRDGYVPYDIFDRAVESVKSGERAPAGPLGDMLGAAAQRPFRTLDRMPRAS